MSDTRDNGRRKVIKGGAALGASAIASPLFFTRNAWAQNFRNNPGDKKSVVLGFNVPQTGAYADEGADELRAYKLAAKELNGRAMAVRSRPSNRRNSRVTASSARRSSTSPATRRRRPTRRAPPPSA